MKTPPAHWQLVESVRRRIHTAMLLPMAVALLWVALPAVTAFLFTRVLAGRPSARLAALLAGLVLVSHLLWMQSFKQSYSTALELEKVLRLKLAERIGHAPPGLAVDSGAAALMQVIQDDVAALHTFVVDSVPLYAHSFAAPLFAFLIPLFSDWRLVLAAAAMLAVGMGMLLLVMKKGQSEMKAYVEAREQVGRAMVEFVQGMGVIRTFDGGAASFGRYNCALDGYLGYLKGWYKKGGLPTHLGLVALSPLSTLSVLLWCGAYQYTDGSLLFAAWFAALLTGAGVAETIIPYMVLFHAVEGTKMSAERTTELFDTPVLSARGEGRTPEGGGIMFGKACFSYPDRQDRALGSVGFTAKAGTQTASAGASGSGKSAVARLAVRFWDADKGSICVGGTDVRDIDPDASVLWIVFVSQDNFLFTGSITDSIRLSIPDAVQTDIEDAARTANAHDFITRLPQGYATPVDGRGASLSGDQRQRITIACAILQNRPILILGETTAYTDTENEVLTIGALEKLMHGKTVPMAVYRLSTVTYADSVFVSDQGCLKEQGMHTQLLVQNSIYAEPWHAHKQSKTWHYDGCGAAADTVGSPTV